MEARALLATVAGTYRRLRALSAEAHITSETGDEITGSHHHHRARFLYAAPTRMRYETSLEHGGLLVCDGTELHQRFGGHRMAPRPRVTTVAVPPFAQLPHVFKPQHPMGGDDEPFLYHHIADDLISAEQRADEDGCHVVSARYTAAPLPYVVDRSPVTFWIDPRTMLVLRQRGEQVMRFPTEDEVQRSRYDVAVLSIRADEEPRADAFVFAPPPEAVALPHGCGMFSTGAGAGFGRRDEKGGGWIEHRGSHEWEGDTLVEHSTWKLRGVSVAFERRMQFADKGAELQVEEIATGPHGRERSRMAVRLK